MKVLVAGGAGFIGSHVVDRLLERGDTVTVLDSFITGRRKNIAHLSDHDDLIVRDFDICEPFPPRTWIDLGPYKETGRFDAVLNFASPASPSDFASMPLRILETGSVGSRNLLTLATNLKARYFFASTSEVYGDPEVHPQPETYNGSVNVCGPRACYDEAKRFGEALALSYARAKGTDVAITRIFNTYGERMNPYEGRVINTFIRQALKGEPLTIYGDGSQTRSFCHVNDLVDGLIALLDHSTTRGPMNLGSTHEVTMNQLAATVIAVTGSESRVAHLPLPQERIGDPKQRCPDLTYAQMVLGYKPSISLEEGLGYMVEYFQTSESL